MIRNGEGGSRVQGVEGSRRKKKGKEGRPEDLSKEIVDTVSTISEIAGKTVRTLFNGLSLLKLPEEIRMAIVPPLSGLNRTEVEP